VSFSQLFAKKYKYKISPNQELFAYGIGNVASSFFNGFPGCVGISRCFIGDGIGVKTQIVALINTIIVLVVILALGPLLATLPKVNFKQII
jgi:MFS superfamily sulfate permease-like transporter